MRDICENNFSVNLATHIFSSQHVFTFFGCIHPSIGITVNCMNLPSKSICVWSFWRESICITKRRNCLSHVFKNVYNALCWCFGQLVDDPHICKDMKINLFLFRWLHLTKHSLINQNIYAKSMLWILFQIINELETYKNTKSAQFRIF